MKLIGVIEEARTQGNVRLMVQVSNSKQPTPPTTKAVSAGEPQTRDSNQQPAPAPAQRRPLQDITVEEVSLAIVNGVGTFN